MDKLICEQKENKHLKASEFIIKYTRKSNVMEHRAYLFAIFQLCQNTVVVLFCDSLWKTAGRFDEHL